MTTVVLVGELYRIRVERASIDVVVDPRKVPKTKAGAKAADDAAEALASLAEMIVAVDELELSPHAPNPELKIARLLATRLRGVIVQRSEDDQVEAVPEDAVD